MSSMEHITMSSKELTRYQVLSGVLEGQLALQDAVVALGVCPSQARWLLERLGKDGHVHLAVNFFLPSLRLQEKTRRGSRVLRRYIPAPCSILGVTHSWAILRRRRPWPPTCLRISGLCCYPGQ